MSGSAGRDQDPRFAGLQFKPLAQLRIHAAGLSWPVVQAWCAADDNPLVRKASLHQFFAMNTAVDENPVDAVQRLQRVASDIAVHEHRGRSAPQACHAAASAAFERQIVADDEQPWTERL